MVAYSFKQQFVAPILSGTKSQTIRADRKRHAREGEQLQLFVGMRTRRCRKIGTATCIGTVPITIDLPFNTVMIGGAIYQGWGKLNTLARHDGFYGWLAMREFWRVNHPNTTLFSGVLIRWVQFVATSPDNHG